MSRTTADNPPLDRWRVDNLLEPERPIWGLPHIARILGVSRDTARRWAKDPEIPIHQPSGAGQHFAFHSELMTWLRSKSGE